MSFSRYLEKDATVASKILPLILSYLGAMGFFTLFFGSEWLTLRRFANEGIETVGTVIEVRCGDHETFIYDYVVNGRTYRSGGGGGYGNRECRDLKPGDPVRVWFLPRYPSQDIPGDPRLRLNNQSLGILVMPIWFAIPYTIIIWRTRRRLKRAGSTAVPVAEP